MLNWHNFGNILRQFYGELMGGLIIIIIVLDIFLFQIMFYSIY
jgi:hypothetical protein